MVPFSTPMPSLNAALDDIMPFVEAAAIEDLAFRLSGLSGAALTQECVRLTAAIFTDMLTLGHEIGAIEKGVVLATLRAALAKAERTPTGQA